MQHLFYNWDSFFFFLLGGSQVFLSGLQKITTLETLRPPRVHVRLAFLAPLGYRPPTPTPLPHCQSDSLAPGQPLLYPVGGFQPWPFGSQGPVHRGPSTSLAKKGGDQSSSLGGAEPPIPRPHSETGLQSSGRGLAPCAAARPLRFTSRTVPKARREEGKFRGNNTALLPRPAPSSALPTPAVQTLFVHQGWLSL